MHATQRGKLSLAAEAIRGLIDIDEWQIGEVRKARKEADAGNVVTETEAIALARIVVERNPTAVARLVADCGIVSAVRAPLR